MDTGQFKRMRSMDTTVLHYIQSDISGDAKFVQNECNVPHLSCIRLHSELKFTT